LIGTLLALPPAAWVLGRGDIPVGAYRDDLRPIDPDKSDI
jgi:hypothetical protein